MILCCTFLSYNTVSKQHDLLTFLPRGQEAVWIFEESPVVSLLHDKIGRKIARVGAPFMKIPTSNYYFLAAVMQKSSGIVYYAL